MRTPQVAFPLAHCTPLLPATKVRAKSWRGLNSEDGHALNTHGV